MNVAMPATVVSAVTTDVAARVADRGRLTASADVAPEVATSVVATDRRRPSAVATALADARLTASRACRRRVVTATADSAAVELARGRRRPSATVAALIDVTGAMNRWTRRILRARGADRSGRGRQRLPPPDRSGDHRDRRSRGNQPAPAGERGTDGGGCGEAGGECHHRRQRREARHLRVGVEPHPGVQLDPDLDGPAVQALEREDELTRAIRRECGSQSWSCRPQSRRCCRSGRCRRRVFAGRRHRSRMPPPRRRGSRSKTW